MKSIYTSELWIKDIDETIAALPVLGELAGKTVFITGCTGLICSAVADIFIRYNETHDEKIRIIAAGRSREKAEKRFYPYSGESWFSFAEYDAASSSNILSLPCDYIIHGAGNATPDKMMKEPVETMLDNFTGIKYLLDYAKAVNAKRVLYISSSEIYGQKDGTEPFGTDEYGYIDILSPRNSYSVGKRAAETLCVSYAAEYGTDAVIVRPGHIYGPTASESDTRVSSVWSFAAAAGKNLVMKSDGAQIRSYCHCLDCASAIIKVLIDGEANRAYNISNPDSVITIRDMAKIISGYAGVELKTEIPGSSEKKSFNPMSNSSLDSIGLSALGWKGIFPAEKGFAHTIDILREII